MIDLLNCDCMDYMRGVPDRFFDLAIVDPPYGIGESAKKRENAKSDKWTNPKKKVHNVKNWDSAKPCEKYFNELFRISAKQIVWGGNYFQLHISGGWIVWDKKRPEDFSLSVAELAWCSFGGRVALFRYLWNGFSKEMPEERFHPTQKPIKLYKWLLKNYANAGDKIFDSHLGSGSIAIACHDMKFDLVGCEIDKDYYDAAVKRFNNHKKQTQLW